MFTGFNSSSWDDGRGRSPMQCRPSSTNLNPEIHSRARSKFDEHTHTRVSIEKTFLSSRVYEYSLTQTNDKST